MAVRQLKDPDLRRLRALRMIDMRIRGKTMKEVAEEFGVSQDTVERTLSWAKKAELVVEAEDKILKDILPAAHAAILRVMDGENLEVAAKTALEIYKGTLPSFSRKAGTGASSESSSDLATYINTIRNDLLTDGEVVGGTDASSGAAQRLITAGETQSPSEELPEPAASDGCASDEARSASGGK